jgi:preprotein translocase subunit Sss1
MSDVQSNLIEPLKQFYKDSKNLVQKCTKPDHKGKQERQTEGVG